MIIYKTNLVDPQYNLATEEYLVISEKYSDNILFLWQNDNTIVVGRNQNSSAEINLQAANDDGVKIIRRNTGGGTVFHDMGNLNYSLIYNDNKDLSHNLFAETIKPVIDCLNILGVKARLRGKNDIEVEGKKISGNAMWKHKNRILHHGTLLFNANLGKLNKYLTVDREKIASKNIKSVASRVANINEFVDLSIDEFMESLIKHFSQLEEIKYIKFDEEDLTEINKIYKNKYLDNNWTFSKNATFTLSNKDRIEGKGSVEANLNIVDGLITEAKFYGDFLGSQGSDELENRLIECKYDVQSIWEVLECVNVQGIFGEKFTNQEILNLLIQ